MKYVRYQLDNKVCYGSLEGDRIFSIEGDIFGEYQISNTAVELSKVKLLSPCSPSKIVCVGLNYRDHAEECSIPLPESPIIFMKPSSSVIGPLDNIIYPDISSRVDYEAELAVVIKQRTKNVPITEAMDCILGVTCANDVTARDLQPANGQWTISKSFDTFLPLGPYITNETDISSLDIECRLNGRTVQHSNTANLIFKVDFLISWISRVMTLYPGDVIITGTPSGIGPMKPGDTVEVQIEKLGVLKNFVSMP